MWYRTGPAHALNFKAQPFVRFIINFIHALNLHKRLIQLLINLPPSGQRGSM